MSYREIDTQSREQEVRDWITVAAHAKRPDFQYITFTFSTYLLSQLGIKYGDRVKVSLGELADRNWLRIEKSPTGHLLSKPGKALRLSLSARKFGYQGPKVPAERIKHFEVRRSDHTGRAYLLLLAPKWLWWETKDPAVKGGPDV